MTKKDNKGKELPSHLAVLFGDKEQDDSKKQIEEWTEREGGKIQTGRWKRAFNLSKIAVKGSGQWVTSKARQKVMSDDPKAEKERLKKQGIELATQMLETFSEMRGAAMKFGQMMSYLGEFLPPEAQKILAVLQRDAPAMPWEDIRAQFMREFDEPPDVIFDQFDKEPIAAASIGQVHLARLHDGTQVAVKIQYPGIDEAMRSDLKNAKFFGLFQQMFFFRTDTKAIMKEIEERLMDECDYEKEADYQEKFAACFKGHPWIVVPEVHRDYCSQRVLTTTYYEGVSFYEWLDQDPSQEERERTAQLFYRFYLGSLYIDGLFNCDPHPGNYLFLKDGRIVFLDYGCTRAFPEDRLELWKDLCKASYEDDVEKMHSLAVPIGFFPEGLKYHEEAFYELLRYMYRPYLVDEPFDFRKQQPENTFREMFLDNPNLFKLNMPADAVFLNRIGFGLVSLLTEIGATFNCRSCIESYFDRHDPYWPEGSSCSVED